MNNQISSFVRIPAGVTVRIPSRNESEGSLPIQGDGEVDAAVFNGLGEEALTGLNDSRLLQTLANRNKKDAAELGTNWTGSYRDMPVYSNRGQIGLKQDSTFKLGEDQTLAVDWDKRNVSLTSAGAAGESLEVKASFNYDGTIKPESVEETFYFFAK